jgi:membrane protein
VEVESTLLRWIDAVFSPELTSGIVAPMVRGLLQQERAGFALGSFVVSLFLASRIFRSAIDTLDAAYDVEERRGTISLWILGFLFSLGSIVTAAAILSMVVVGPLLGGGRAIAEWLGFGDAFQMAWTLVRMPVVFVIATAFLAALYRFGPNIRNSWRRSLPGAVVGMALLILISIGFRLYLGISGIDSPQIGDADEAVSIGAQAIGVLLAALLWIWLSGISILTGGVVNAELQHLRTRDRARESNAH